MPFRPFYWGTFLALLLALAGCHPHERISPRLHGTLLAVRTVSISSKESLLGIQVLLSNRGKSDERIRRYFLRTPSGDLSEALTSGTIRERFQEHVQSWGRMGLPTVVPSGGAVRGWLFFERAALPGKLVFRLLNTYGTAEALFVPVPSRTAAAP
ncbi:MAG: hypothetical protein ACYDAM_06915 [Leptospirales bacterium]